MPEIKQRTPKRQKEKDKKKEPSTKRHIGVKASHTPGKFVGQAWDKKNKKNVHLGTFDGELLAAAAYQKHIGNTKEAQRLRNEHEEGSCQPETVHKRMFEEDTPNRAMSPSEE